MNESLKKKLEFSNHAGLSQEELSLLLERTESLSHGDNVVIDTAADVDDEFLVVAYLNERYGIPLKVVSEVISIDSIVDLPGAPIHLMGLTRLRGQIVALVNLHVFWRNAVAGHNDCDYAVIIHTNNISYGLLCHKALGVTPVSKSRIEASPANLPDKTKETIVGIYDRNILLIDPVKLISCPGFVVD